MFILVDTTYRAVFIVFLLLLHTQAILAAAEVQLEHAPLSTAEKKLLLVLSLSTLAGSNFSY